MKEGESGRAWSRAVLGGLGILLEERRVYRDGNWREAGGTSGKVVNSNVSGSIDGSSIVNITK